MLRPPNCATLSRLPTTSWARPAGLHNRTFRALKRSPGFVVGRGSAASVLSLQYRAENLDALEQHRYLENISSAEEDTTHQDIMAASDLVESMIEDNRVMIFSKTDCSYCDKAKSALDKYVDQYRVLELDGREDAAEIQAVLGDLTGETTVPRVFIGGKFVGGGTETVSGLDSVSPQTPL
eukprot:Blabericola_migrator_1__4821@NODE_2530_length_2641_cov_14_040404_g1582_i0_p1_GENE_NODE_2530_length_2641_cov_14_040404_g1582_i0NODE_2530_length_2641_cov_14_040404_g1582_i0_p1_ORF_typecomplete_len180_score14_35Glutaredoxin/PF00462_24/4_3e16DUF836/PF05768_14/0_00049Thioredoxin_3/PF13192_6/0_0026Thioredoxin_2/PF13098_6/7_2e03Thioredoxin_2/PF13098_6/0_022TraF/PF13728_6/0_018Thioredoxin_4/PF13462_6/5Thioredoxin_4/PF13462_6/1e02_NODE_2530_length_2641_cov_14_040404_g1582_i019792518